MKKFLALLLCSLLTASCMTDLGNYEYHDLEEPQIAGLADTLHLEADRHLKLSPSLQAGDYPESEWEFEWRAISGEGTETRLGSHLELDTEVRLVPGSYQLLFRMTERATGIFWQKKMLLQINDLTSEGWMVLCSEGPDRRARLDMYSAITGEVVTDVLAGNGMPDLHGPYRISWMDGNRVDRNSPFYLTTEEGATRLGKNGFEWKEEYRLDYEIGQSVSPHPVQINEVTNGKMLSDGGKVYFSDCLVSTGLFAEVRPAFNAAPVIGANLVNSNIFIPMALLYDLEKKCFMGYAPNLRDDLMGGAEPLHEMNEMVALLRHLSNAGDITGTAFDAFPHGLDYVWMENTRYDPNKTGTGITYAVLRAPEDLTDGKTVYQKGHLYLFGIQTGELLGGNDFNGPAFAIGKACFADITGCEDIARASHFAFSSLNAYMYYAVGSRVYRADLTDASKVESTLQFSLPGEEISVLKFNLYKDSARYLEDYDLVVAGNRSGRGTLRIYDGFLTEGDFSEVEPEIHRGFGEIVDATYREMLD